jgi:toxin ParE1/3/4
MNRVELSVSAELDLDEIVDYVAEDRPSAAKRLEAQFNDTFQMLATGPHVGEDMSRRIVGLRRFTMSRYVIYFEPADFGIRVVRVFDSARDHENLL